MVKFYRSRKSKARAVGALMTRQRLARPKFKVTMPSSTALVPTSNSTLTGLIKRVVKGQAETKYTMFYENYNPGNSSSRNTLGLYANRGFMVQNKTISTNNTDIKQLIPFVVQGVSDNQRMGSRISPTSLKVRGTIRVSNQDQAPVPPATTPELGYLKSFTPLDIKVVIYVLQHVSLKDYENLYASNDFNQLLENGENTTVQFGGQNWHNKLPIAKQYYKLLKKKVVTLRYAGAENATVTSVAYSIANSHNYYANYELNLSKYIPANLKYPENNVTGPALNTPTNSSIFMCMGFYDQKEYSNGQSFSQLGQLEQTYVSTMTYKDT